MLIHQKINKISKPNKIEKMLITLPNLIVGGILEAKVGTLSEALFQEENDNK